MNFDDAITAHVHWKLALASYLAKHDGSLKARDLEPDDKCPLGLWIHGEGRRHAAFPEFKTLEAEHARFHKAAAHVVIVADSGASVREETALGGNSPFSTASLNLMGALMAMKRKTGR